MTHTWSILCRKALVEQETNIMSLLEVVEEINIPIDKEKFEKAGKVTVPCNFNIVHFISKEEKKEKESGNVMIEFYNPSGQKHKNTIEQKFEIKNPQKGVRVSMILGVISFKEPGRHSFIVKLRAGAQKKYIKVATLPFYVNFLEKKISKKK